MLEKARDTRLALRDIILTTISSRTTHFAFMDFFPSFLAYNEKHSQKTILRLLKDPVNVKELNECLRRLCSYLELATLDHKSRRGAGKKKGDKLFSISRGEDGNVLASIEVTSRSTDTASEVRCSKTEEDFTPSNKREDDFQCCVSFLAEADEIYGKPSFFVDQRPEFDDSIFKELWELHDLGFRD